MLEAALRRSRYVPEHVAQAFEDTLLGFVLVLVLFFVFFPFRFFLLLPVCLVPIFLSVIFRKMAVRPGTGGQVAAGGH